MRTNRKGDESSETTRTQPIQVSGVGTVNNLIRNGVKVSTKSEWMKLSTKVKGRLGKME